MQNATCKRLKFVQKEDRNLPKAMAAYTSLVKDLCSLVILQISEIDHYQARLAISRKTLGEGIVLARFEGLTLQALANRLNTHGRCPLAFGVFSGLQVISRCHSSSHQANLDAGVAFFHHLHAPLTADAVLILLSYALTCLIGLLLEAKEDPTGVWRPEHVSDTKTPTSSSLLSKSRNKR